MSPNISVVWEQSLGESVLACEGEAWDSPIIVWCHSGTEGMLSGWLHTCTSVTVVTQ